jgi:hypothetical protein
MMLFSMIPCGLTLLVFILSHQGMTLMIEVSFLLHRTIALRTQPCFCFRRCREPCFADDDPCRRLPFESLSFSIALFPIRAHQLRKRTIEKCCGSNGGRRHGSSMTTKIHGAVESSRTVTFVEISVCVAPAQCILHSAQRQNGQSTYPSAFFSLTHWSSKGMCVIRRHRLSKVIMALTIRSVRSVVHISSNPHSSTNVSTIRPSFPSFLRIPFVVPSPITVLLSYLHFPTVLVRPMLFLATQLLLTVPFRLCILLNYLCSFLSFSRVLSKTLPLLLKQIPFVDVLSNRQSNWPLPCLLTFG